MTVLRAFLVAVFTGAAFAVVLAAWLDRAQRRLEAKLDAIAALVALIRGTAGVSGDQKAKEAGFRNSGWPGARS